MKHQAPSTKHQRSPKPRASVAGPRYFALNVGVWNSSGVWRLVLGAFLAVMLASSATGQASTKSGFQIEHQSDRLIITREAQPVAHFVFADTNILRPYFAHVHTPDGIQVTRNHPPIAGTDPVDHPTMHPGIWLAFGDISGQDFWRNRATIRHERFIGEPSVAQDKLTFATESTLVTTNDRPVAKLISHLTIAAHTDGFLLTWQAVFTPLTGNFAFGDQEEMGFGIRVATPLSEKQGGTVRNHDGIIGAKNAWGKTAAWCDYSGVLSNRLVGITVLTDPKNFRPSWFHSRDYGLLVANPFGQKAFTKGEPSRVTVPRDQAFELRFAAFIHSTPPNQPPDIANACSLFINQD